MLKKIKRMYQKYRRLCVLENCTGQSPVSKPVLYFATADCGRKKPIFIDLFSFAAAPVVLENYLHSKIIFH
jgi:hypothetical protein